MVFASATRGVLEVEPNCTMEYVLLFFHQVVVQMILVIIFVEGRNTWWWSHNEMEFEDFAMGGLPLQSQSLSDFIVTSSTGDASFIW